MFSVLLCCTFVVIVTDPAHSAPPTLSLIGRDDQRFGDHACRLRPGEDQRSRHIQQPTAQQETQESRREGQEWLHGLPKSVKCRSCAAGNP